MGTVELKNSILKKLNAIEDTTTLQNVLKYLETYSNEETIVAYSTLGEPITEKEYKKRVKDADASIDAGNFTTLEDLEKDIQDW